MEPITINIKVGFEDTALQILTSLVTAAARSDEKPAEQKAAKLEQKAVNVEQKVVRTEQPAPVQEPAPQPAEAAPVEDMPDFTTEITDTELRAVVTATRQRIGSAAPIKKLLTETYGVKLSVECPQEKRAALIEDLKRL